MSAWPFSVGDRVRFVGRPVRSEDDDGDLLPGELGTVIDLYEPAGVLVVAWDEHGSLDMAGTTEIEKIHDR